MSVIENIDGIMKLDSGLTTVGGILKDGHGVRSLGLTGVWVVVCREALQAIQDFFSKISSSMFIRCMQQNLLDISQWKLGYIPREMNLKANCIAKMTFDRNEGLHLVEDTPLDWIRLL
ncbi:hypothetical protein Gorai_005195 [Gossypium raimondii]|uniref:RNase H type-1 domain-containing protein n=1 Tax=Gossypium raimondii TaxID=29730 RepID=A0A7J8QCF2_GOSRA|nr:hypothetical protein [Gossypium raimondii]